MNKTPEPKKLVKVVSKENLPTRNSTVVLAALYHLFDLQYAFPMWADIAVYVVLTVWFLVAFERLAREVAVDIFKE